MSKNTTTIKLRYEVNSKAGLNAVIRPYLKYVNHFHSIQTTANIIFHTRPDNLHQLRKCGSSWGLFEVKIPASKYLLGDQNVGRREYLRM